MVTPSLKLHLADCAVNFTIAEPGDFRFLRYEKV
jgi:hypothetical protein